MNTLSQLAETAIQPTDIAPRVQIITENDKLLFPKKRLEKYIQQNSAVNNELVRNALLNNLFQQNIDGQMHFYPYEVKTRNQQGNNPVVYTLCAFSYKNNVDLEEISGQGMYKITAFDRRVYNTISTLWLAGRTTVSVPEIYEMMNGYKKKNPNQKQVQAINKALIKFSNVRVYIDFTEELNSKLIKDPDILIKAGILKSRKEKITKAVMDDQMLHFRNYTFTTKSGQEYKYIQMLAEPCLLLYNRAKGSLLSIPMKFLALKSVRATERSLAIQDYLMMRIINYQNGAMKENRIMYQTLYKNAGLELPGERVGKRKEEGEELRDPKASERRMRSVDRSLITSILGEWKENDLIESFDEIKDGGNYIGVSFQAKKQADNTREEPKEE